VLAASRPLTIPIIANNGKVVKGVIQIKIRWIFGAEYGILNRIPPRYWRLS